MPSQDSATGLRKRAGSPTRTTVEEHKFRTHTELIADHPEIQPQSSTSSANDPSEGEGSSLDATTSGTTTTTTTTSPSASLSPSIGSRILSILFKPFYFLIFVILHLGHELAISARTMKTMVQVFFLPHLFPVAPELVRILRGDLGTDLKKKPKHLAVILPANSTSDEEEEDWHTKVAQLAQWSVACGIQCLSVMRTDPLHPLVIEPLQERIDHSLEQFYKEESSVPVALVRTLRPVEDTVFGLNEQGDVMESEAQILQRLHGGRKCDLDVVILSERDGHDRLAANVRALGEAALHDEIRSQDIDMNFMDRHLSAGLTEPELLIVFKDEVDLSSYPPWHIRLTEIYHHQDQAYIPQYTMFLQAMHRYAKIEQRFGK
ncbi:hypothetical protein BGX31_000328 [Mortierella sp. GBA43]|nr:hypothetical protein BGX31_000328 [Mortierella sp. GBA43]